MLPICDQFCSKFFQELSFIASLKIWDDLALGMSELGALSSYFNCSGFHMAQLSGLSLQTVMQHSVLKPAHFRSLLERKRSVSSKRHQFSQKMSKCDRSCDLTVKLWQSHLGCPTNKQSAGNQKWQSSNGKCHTRNKKDNQERDLMSEIQLYQHNKWI